MRFKCLKACQFRKVYVWVLLWGMCIHWVKCCKCDECYQNMRILVAKLFTWFTIYKDLSQGLKLLVVRNTDKYIWCQNCDTLLNIQYNYCSLYNSSYIMWNPCWSINGHSSSALKAACATPYKGISGALWEGNHLSEHGCPLAGATGHAY